VLSLQRFEPSDNQVGFEPQKLLIYVLDAFYSATDLGKVVFLGPQAGVGFAWLLVFKAGSILHLCRGPPQKSIFCGADFGFTISLDLRQKFKPFLHSSQKQMVLRSFLENYSSLV